ncbi:LOW QUALITY PROTEIN: Retrotransposable element [Phytophthora megakarya]|uniref:Retrotransposable element n=1 Tax=Phytophthora megakarya TaxID=4795 RepID=A0A225WFU5_9STRA|nr:LOW QUALITY PROTEIN: Retrotransposable element [Phytophthora megakarya]
MGLANAPAIFNAGIRAVSADFHDICQSYFDDIYVFTRGHNIQDHLDALGRVNFTVDAGPMFDLLESTAKQIPWTDELLQHFNLLKQTIHQTPVLGIAYFSRKVFLRMDASEFAMGGRKYKATEVNYSIREKELLAILFGLRNWRVYLLDQSFVSKQTPRAWKRYSNRKVSHVAFLDDGIPRRPDFEDNPEVVTLAKIMTRAELREQISTNLPANKACHAIRPYHISFVDHLKNPSTSQSPALVIKHLDRYSLSDNNKVYQAHHDSKSRVVIPRLREITEALIAEFRDSPVYGHPVIDRTSRLVEANYFWPN